MKINQHTVLTVSPFLKKMKQKFKFEVKFLRTKQFDSQLYGFAYSGPFGHFLHKLMDKIFKGNKGNDTVAKKVW